MPTDRPLKRTPPAKATPKITPERAAAFASMTSPAEPNQGVHVTVGAPLGKDSEPTRKVLPRYPGATTKDVVVREVPLAGRVGGVMEIIRNEPTREARPPVDLPDLRCPECSKPLRGVAELPLTSLLTVCLPRVCWSCAAIFMLDNHVGTRLLRTQEWYDLLCKPGHDHLFTEREKAIAQITDPSPRT